MDLNIRPLTLADREAALAVVNTAAQWYREFLPADEQQEAEMTPADWDEESRRMTWYGAFAGETLVGVTGLEYARDAALLRHGYVLQEYQRHGVGSQLLAYLERQVREAGQAQRIIAGTYAQNYKARTGLEKAGFSLSADSEAVLRTYYAVPEARLASSVTYEKAAQPPSP